MPTVQIDDVPERIYEVLRGRAIASGQTLSEYLLGRLVAEAGRPTLDELLGTDEGLHGRGVTLDEATAAVRQDRDSR